MTMNVANVLLSFSDAIDLAAPVLAQHQQRVAFAALEMGTLAGLPEDLIETTFIAALLHDVGALSFEEKSALHNFEGDCEMHCIRGAILVHEVPWLRSTTEIIRHHHRPWTVWGEPIDTPHVMASQLIMLADHLERLVNRSEYILHQEKELVSRITALSGSVFHPDIVDLFVQVSCREEFWLDLASPRLYSLLLHDGPHRQLTIDLPRLKALARLFQHVVDFGSRFTATHSAGVAACAEILGRLFTLTDMEVEMLSVAGALHDLGKLSVSNDILYKPAKLSEKEFEIMRSHTYFTYSVLSSIPGMRQIAEWAAFHHERLDGTGYPFRCKAEELSTGSRILMVADLFTAIAEERPYRAPMKREEVVGILQNLANRGIMDANIIQLLLDNQDTVFPFVEEQQRESLNFFETRFDKSALDYSGL